jgi:integrase
MARPKGTDRIDSKAARASLKPRGRPYFNDLGADAQLGVRRNRRRLDTWLIRLYDPATTEREDHTFAEADSDSAPTDGKKILDYRQAQTAGRALAAKLRSGAGDKTLTMATAFAEKFEVAEAAERAKIGPAKTLRRGARLRLTRHVTDPGLLDKPLAELVASDLMEWQRAVAGKVAGSTVKRIVVDMKAALNLAAHQHRARLPNLAEEVRAGFRSTYAAAPVARPAQVLPDADIRRILAAVKVVDAKGEWDGDLYLLFAVMAATGGRLSQLVRCTVADFRPDQGRLLIPASFKGKGQKAQSHVAMPIGADIVALLRPVVAGRLGHEMLLLRPRWRPERAGRVGVWEKYDRGPWDPTAGLTVVWRLIRDEAGMAADLVPYCLRHSAIVRALRNGLPLALTAKLFDTSGRMIEAHYSRFIVDALGELAARALATPLLPTEPTTLRVVP